MERKKDKDARSLFTLEPFQLYRQGRCLVHHAQPPAKVEFGDVSDGRAWGCSRRINSPFGKKFQDQNRNDHRSDATDLIRAVHCRVAGGKRIMPSVDDLWATRRFDASPISVSMRIVAVAPPNAARTEICAKAETAEVRVGATTQNIDQKITQNKFQIHNRK
jgi:hypothetical protein